MLRIVSLTPCFSGVFCDGTETQNRFNFNGFYVLSKTAEAVRTPSPHSYTPLKQGVNEMNPLRMRMFVKHSG